MGHFVFLKQLQKKSTNAFCLQCRRRLSKISLTLGENELSFETGRLARFADGAAVARLGDTAVMVTAVSRSKATTANFIPLTVDYRQKAAAGGRIPTNFLRRELGTSDHEILTSRMIDRSIRPLFPKGYACETQVACNLLAVDGIHDPDVISINAASAALALSDIPWNGPLGAVRVGYVEDQVIINPTRRQLQDSKVNLVVVGTSREPKVGKKSISKILMMEMSADNIPLAELQRCAKVGLSSVKEITGKINELANWTGKQKREILTENSSENDAENLQKLKKTTKILAESQLRAILTDFSHDKISRDTAVTEVRKDVVAKLSESFPQESQGALESVFTDFVKEIFRELIFETGIRCDGRHLDDLRRVNCEVDLYKPLHGSALFQRGQTQVLCTVAFDSPDSAFRSDPMSILTGAIKEKNFMLHYEFPPYATNEISTGRWVGRRELGHGALAEKGLRPVVPKNFPFTIRLTSEVLESNGSSSMATVCGGSLALMDAGVPILAPVAGVAVGLVTKQNEKNPDDIGEYKVLTDITGMEDFCGDMDFKIAGTKRGFTAIQLDLKIPGITMAVLNDALNLATKSKKDLLTIMNLTLKEPRDGVKKDGPISEELEVPANKRSRFVGLGGYNLKKLQANIGVQITPLEECKFSIFAPNREAMQEVKEQIEELLKEEKEPELEFGAVYTAKIVELRSNGAMVILHPTMPPVMVPTSQLDQRRVGHPSALGLELGQEVSVKYFGRDPATGHIRLSRKVLQTTLPPGTRHLLTEKDREVISPWGSDRKSFEEKVV